MVTLRTNTQTVNFGIKTLTTVKGIGTFVLLLIESSEVQSWAIKHPTKSIVSEQAPLLKSKTAHCCQCMCFKCSDAFSLNI